MNPLQKIKQYFTKPSVTILIPTFQAESFICETLDSLKKQDFRNFQILISIDKSEDETKSVIKRWCQKNKKIPTQIFCQTDYLGWVKNINFLLKKCQTKYFMVLPHDDLLDKTYILKMIQCLEMNQHACTAFSDIQGFGTKKPIITQNSIKGKRLERTLEFLIYHESAVAFRGLVNRDVISDFILLPENNCSNFAIDTVWNLQMTLKGELIRIPEVLYHKRYHDDSVNDSWQKFGKEKKIHVWLEHCRDCLKIIFRAGFEVEELYRLIEASKSRLVQEVYPLWAYKELSSLDERDRASLTENLEKTIIALGETKNYSRSQLLHRKYI